MMKSALCDRYTWLPLVSAAEQLGSTPLNVLMHIKRGLLVGREGAAGWLVDADSLDVLLARRQRGAVPAVCRSGCGKQAGTCGSCG